MALTALERKNKEIKEKNQRIFNLETVIASRNKEIDALQELCRDYEGQLLRTKRSPIITTHVVGIPKVGFFKRLLGLR